MFLFLHIPKTAGTSVIHLFAKFKKIHYGRVHDISKNEMQKYNNFSKDFEYLIHGHISYKEILSIDKHLYDTFTIIRNPIDRCLSWYYYTNQGKSIVGKKMTIKEFFNSNHPGIIQNCYNRMTYQLGDYAHISKRNKLLYHVLLKAKENSNKLKFIIVYENLKDDVERIFETNLPCLNKTEDYPKDISDDERNEIIKCNHLDIELYNYIMDNLGCMYTKFKIL